MPAAPHRVDQRRVHRGWVAAGVLLIVLSALGSAALFRALGPSQEYLAVAAEVPVGAQVQQRDLMVVRLHPAPGLQMVPAEAADDVVGGYATVTLSPGSLITPEQVTDEPVPAPGEQLVAITLSRHALPGGQLRAGDPVLLVATGQGSGDEPATVAATVHQVAAAGRGDTVAVSVRVAEGDGPAVATLAAAGRLTVVRVPAGQQ